MMDAVRDVESTEVLMRAPLVQQHCKDGAKKSDHCSLWMVMLSTAVAVCGSFEFGSCVGYSAPAQSGIVSEMGLSLSEYAIFGSILNIGSMIGAVTSGSLADYIGHKKAMQLSSIVCIIGWLTIYFAKGAMMLYSGRVLTGYGTGVFSYVVPVFISEISPKDLRGGLGTLNQLLIVLGGSTVYIVGTLVTWRTLVLIGLLPCITLLVGLLFIPESPRWLANAGRQEDFQEALQKLRGKNADTSSEAMEILEYIESLRRLPEAKIQNLFESKYALPIIIGIGLMFFQQFGGINGVGFYASHTFASAGFSGEIGTILIGVIRIPITILGAILMDRSGRRALLLVSASGTFLGCFVAAISFYLKEQGLLLELVPTLALSGILVFVGAFAIGLGAVPWVIMSEIFPINIKAIAGSLVTLVNWSSSFTVSFTFNFLMSWSPAGTFFIFSAVSAMTILFVVLLVPETKGRTLEEIQASMSR